MTTPTDALAPFILDAIGHSDGMAAEEARRTAQQIIDAIRRNEIPGVRLTPDSAPTPNLVGFCSDVMESWPEGGVDGGQLQEIAEKHGLLVPEERTEFCEKDEDGCGTCPCAEYHGDPSEGFTCYRRVPLQGGVRLTTEGARGEVRRYSPTTAIGDYDAALGHKAEYPCLTVRADGECVMYSDFARVVGERESLSAKLAEAEQQLSLAESAPDMNGASISLCREMMAKAGVPEAAFFDDFVGNAITLWKRAEKERDNLRAQLDGARGLLRECLLAVVRLLNQTDPDCSICGGMATPTINGHRKACTVQRVACFLKSPTNGKQQ